MYLDIEFEYIYFIIGMKKTAKKANADQLRNFNDPLTDLLVSI